VRSRFGATPAAFGRPTATPKHAHDGTTPISSHFAAIPYVLCRRILAVATNEPQQNVMNNLKWNAVMIIALAALLCVPAAYSQPLTIDVNIPFDRR
jgi:hypothetical protein